MGAGGHQRSRANGPNGLGKLPTVLAKVDHRPRGRSLGGRSGFLGELDHAQRLAGQGLNIRQRDRRTIALEDHSVQLLHGKDAIKVGRTYPVGMLGHLYVSLKTNVLGSIRECESVLPVGKTRLFQLE